MQHRTVTSALIAINVIFFIVMVASGVSFFSPTVEHILAWGGSSGDATVMDGQWWRLFSSMFVHIGIIHLLMNMYVLFDIGSLLEPIIGKLRFILVYLATGVFGGLLSQIWHSETLVVEGGASGAVFGIIGALFALSTTNLFVQEVREALLKKMLMLIVVNIIPCVVQSQINMAAHFGGLISGCVLGYALFPSFIYTQYKKVITSLTAALVVVTTVVSTWGAFNYVKKSDLFHFQDIISQLSTLETTIVELEAHEPSNHLAHLSYIETKISPLWEECSQLIQEAERLQLEEYQSRVRAYVAKWVSLSKKRQALILQILKENNYLCVAEVRAIDEQLAALKIEE